MRFRVGILDIGAAVVALVAIFLPAREVHVYPSYPAIDAETAGEISRLQAAVRADPADGAAAEALADLLAQTGYTDWALRVAGAAVDESSPSVWRVYRSLSTTHADRIEIAEASRYAELAVAACDASTACADHEHVRLQLYAQQLHAGLESGIDPKADPAAFRAAVSRAGIRQVRVKGAPQ